MATHQGTRPATQQQQGRKRRRTRPAKPHPLNPASVARCCTMRRPVNPVAPNTRMSYCRPAMVFRGRCKSAASDETGVAAAAPWWRPRGGGTGARPADAFAHVYDLCGSPQTVVASYLSPALALRWGLTA